MAHPLHVSALILDSLAEGEKGLLRLIVVARKDLGRFEKADVSAIVNAALRKLVASGAVVEVDGMYSLSRPQRRLAACAPRA